MYRQQVNLLQGDTFVVSDRHGDIAGSPAQPEGLFHRDVRHLSRWQLRLDGRRPSVLSHTDATEEGVFFLAEPVGSVNATAGLSVIRRREIADGMSETITVHSHRHEAVGCELSILFAADFADLFEVKEQRLDKPGEYYARQDANTITMGYRRADYVRETRIRAQGAYLTERLLTYRIELPAGGSWTGKIEITVTVSPGRNPHYEPHRPRMSASLQQWLADAPGLDTDWCELRHVYRRSLTDLAALRFYPDADDTTSVPAAGLPWFMALFGRDSLLTSYQALPFVPELARSTLFELAQRQATESDDFRDAQPGKILHELRHGELTHFGDRPQSPYYGSADATPLFLIVLEEYERWTADTDTVSALQPAARAAVRWLDEHGDLDGDGYQEYRRRNTVTGIENQSWKDSHDAIVHPDGTAVSLPRAMCELQGYAYDAKLRTARLAEQVWHDQPYADRLRADAARLRDRFNNDFWLPDEGFYALALDGDKKPVPTLASNMGHLLWSGIVPDERATAVAAQLCGSQLYSGWGVRTIAAGQPAYNPIGYHTGTVWPHDTALVAAGLVRYRMHEQARAITVGLLDAAAACDGRLPEALAGYGRDIAAAPVRYPTACSPQAWAAAAPLLLLRLLLDLRPDDDDLTCVGRPVHGVRTIGLTAVPYRGRRLDVRCLPAVWAPAHT